MAYGKATGLCYCLHRGMGEKPPPLGEDFSSILREAKVQGVRGSRVNEKSKTRSSLDLWNPRILGSSSYRFQAVVVSRHNQKIIKLHFRDTPRCARGASLQDIKIGK
jgi:hypothetical protein